MIAHQVHFIGGPLDGHTHLFDDVPDRLPPVATLQVSSDVVRVVTGRKRRAAARPTSTAVYCLDRDGEVSKYYHVASIAVQAEHQLGGA